MVTSLIRYTIQRGIKEGLAKKKVALKSLKGFRWKLRQEPEVHGLHDSGTPHLLVSESGDGSRISLFRTVVQEKLTHEKRELITVGFQAIAPRTMQRSHRSRRMSSRYP